MNKTERRQLAYNTADSIIDGFSQSVRRAAALFETPGEALEKLIAPEINTALGVTIGSSLTISEGYMGETRDLFMLLNNGKSWIDTIREIYAHVEHGVGKSTIQPGDFLYIPVSVPETEIDGVEFSAIEDSNVKVVVTHVFDDAKTKESGVVFNFENVLFHAPVNPESTNEGGLAASTLAKYLNDHFLKAVFAEVEQYLMPNSDGLKISLPTLREVFGSEKDDTVNWGDAVRHPYFNKCTHRIKVNNDDPDDTNWWWLANPTASYSASFCSVYYYGYAIYYYANITGGGVSPAFCVAKRHE